MGILEGIFNGLTEQLFRKSPALPAIFFAMIALFFGYGAVHSWSQVHAFTDEPRPLSFADAVKQTGVGASWVTLYGMQKKCEQAYKDESRYFVPLVNQDNTALVLFSPIKTIDICNLSVTEPVTGLFEKIGPAEYDSLVKIGIEILDLYDRSDIWTLCGSCKRSDAMQSFYISLVVSVLSTLLSIVFSLKRQRMAQ